MAVLACVCLLVGVAQATQTAGGLFKPSENVYGYWAKTLGGVGGEGFLDHVLEASNRLQKELETTRQIMQDLAEAQMHEMLEKLESGEMTLEDDYVQAHAYGEGNTTTTTTEADHRELTSMGLGEKRPNPILTADISPQNLFRGELAPLAQVFTTKPDLRRCTFFGGNEICLPAKRYFIRKSVGFACDLQLKKGTSGEFFACGRPGVSTALCLEWPLEIKVASFITKVDVPICLPDARALEASLRFLGGDVTAIINLLV
eukprot:CAMPEP_0197472426 /NCGR_PEP_ID=MMETSP1309-20131121/3625_1 /TAXON_ID=464262 /ORGANISM="Genus nov. species nov., Strain RCC998" /LENGTH=258 /DNA_ID=CAMNT_0043010959 /DNA_START=147 /DNA_END=923 /DNA_ORIENTATION=+